MLLHEIKFDYMTIAVTAPARTMTVSFFKFSIKFIVFIVSPFSHVGLI